RLATGLTFLLLAAVVAHAGPLEFVRERVVANGSPAMASIGTGIPSKGETVDLALTLANTGSAAARTVTARLTSVTPEFAQILTSTATFGLINAGAEKESLSNVRILIDPLASDFSELTFSMVISESGGAQWPGQFSLSVLPSISVCPAVGNNQNPSYLAYDRVANRLYCTNTQTGSVAVIDPQVNSAVAAFRLGTSPDIAAVDSLGKRLFVLDKNAAAPAVHVVSTEDYSLITKINLPSLPSWITFNPDANKCYVSFDGTGTVRLLECGGYSLQDSVAVGGKPAGSFVDSVSQTLQVVNYGQLAVHVIDLATRQILATLDLKQNIAGLWSGRNGVYDADNRTLYLGASLVGSGLCIVRIRDGSSVDYLPFDGGGLTSIEGLAWDPSRSGLFVVGAAETAFSRVVALAVEQGYVTPELNLQIEGLHSCAVHVPISRRVYIGNARKYRLDSLDALNL
ncbi:MAG TPA: YncE family protein, partial [bacterium]|nr:YncE family protein [bacterium]